uniref:Uncharacterized protein n=1 Tax=Anopheles albimanus TaxID=7167 RepID=A0A182FER9_ANOAL
MERPCAMLGGMCVQTSECNHRPANSGLCPENAHLGVDCCYEVLHRVPLKRGAADPKINESAPEQLAAGDTELPQKLLRLEKSISRSRGSIQRHSTAGKSRQKEQRMRKWQAFRAGSSSGQLYRQSLDSTRPLQYPEWGGPDGHSRKPSTIV